MQLVDDKAYKSGAIECPEDEEWFKSMQRTAAESQTARIYVWGLHRLERCQGMVDNSMFTNTGSSIRVDHCT